jgi:hypothetical protein
MTRRYEIYQNEAGDRLAVPCGFSILAAVFDWIWALGLRLWLESAVLFILNGVLVATLYAAKSGSWGYLIAQVLQGLLIGAQARRLRALSAERRGYSFVCTVPGRNGANAIAKLVQVGGVPLPEWRGRHFFTLPDFVPVSFRRVAAMASLTIKAAFRLRLILVLMGLLTIAVFGLPSVIIHDGTARGFTQIVLTYSLAAITGILGFTTLWLACGTLARDIEDCHIHVVMSKPIARWQIWLGKWLGILLLNAALLAFSGFIVFCLMLGRSSQLPAVEREILDKEVLVARAGAREKAPDLAPVIEQRVAERLKQAELNPVDRQFVRKQITEQVKAQAQVVPSGQIRRWTIDLGEGAAQRLKDEPLFLRVKFFSSEYVSEGATFAFRWLIGPPDRSDRYPLENSLGAESYVEFPIAPNLIDPQGKLVIDMQNFNNLSLFFPLEDGMEVLYREGGFALNFARGLGIILCWLALLGSIGLACSSRMSFQVSSFVCLSVLLVAFSGGTISSVIEQGGIMGVDHDTGRVDADNFVNRTSVQVFGVAKTMIGIAKDFSPVESLSSGRSITWGMLSLAFAQIVLFLGGIFAVIGMVVLTRREIALPT